MTRSEILKAIQQMAFANKGKAPGRTVFEKQTGIKMAEWYPRYWIRWGDALVEAGLTANELQTAISDDFLIESYIAFIRELKHLPVEGEIRRKGKADPCFPSHSTFGRFGGRDKLLEAIRRYCESHSGHADIITLIDDRKGSTEDEEEGASRKELKPVTGFVYLMKSGRHYKIGRTVSVGSRERQLAIQIPVPPTTLHSIETDDPSGVEAYWHRRFADKRGEGEWFNLSSDDVKAFKRWKRIA